jgi:YesN/AraC family two-component response regulator
MKVMIVDDSELLQNRLRKALINVNNNINISQAGSCKEAIELFNPFNPDIVIMDIALPDGSGVELLKRFKKDNPNVNVIVFTNYPTAEFKKSCIEFGADSFFDKSDINRLINSII